MTSGYDANGGHWGANNRDGSDTPFSVAKPVFAPGTFFAYWDDAMNMFGATLTRIANMNIGVYFKFKIADKIHMKNWNGKAGWTYRGLGVSCGAGVPSHGPMVIDALNMAKFCYLFLNKGNWAGEQIISQKWVEAATRPEVALGTPMHKISQGDDGAGIYGYNWWTNGKGNKGTQFFPDAPAKTYAAIGFNGNFCFVVPEWNTVVVHLGMNKDLSVGTMNEFLKRLSLAISI